MNMPVRFSRVRQLMLACAVAIAVIYFPADSTAWSAEKTGTSLDFIPADAAFYSSAMRLKEQVEIVGTSKAWAKLTALPGWQMARQALDRELNKPGGPMEQAKPFLDMPENQELLGLGADMVSNEVFIYGDKSWVESSALFMQVVNAMRWGGFIAAFQERAPPDVEEFQPGEAEEIEIPTGPTGEEIVQTRVMLDVLSGNLDDIQIPELVIGFRLTDTKPAVSQLARLEALGGMLEQQVPQLAGRIKRATAGEAELLTLSVDGTMIPWDQIPWDKYERHPGDYKALRARLGEMTLMVSLGVWGDYLLLSIGDNNDHIAALGKGDLLIDRPEFKSLVEAKPERLTSAGYLSQPLHAGFAWKKQDIEELASLADEFLPGTKLPEELQRRIAKDAHTLADDLKLVIPEVGAVVQFSYLTPRGSESFTYNWSEDLVRDASKRLSLTDHVGGSPIFAGVTRSKYSPEGYKLLVKWLKIGFGYFEDLAVPQMPPEGLENYGKFRKIALPLVERLDRATGTMLLPALADGQVAFVIDAKLKSKQWHQQLPPTPAAMPMLEVALLVGVSDAELLRDAASEYRSVIEDFVKQLREVQPQIPEFKLPIPETREIAGGELFWYSLPPEVGLDVQLVPNAGLSKDVAVLSLSPKHSARLLKDTPLKLEGPLADLDRPLASVVYFNWVGLVEAVEPWVDLAMQASLPPGGAPATKPSGPDDDSEGASDDAEVQDSPAPSAIPQDLPPEFIFEHVRTGLEILKCFRTVTSVTYTEDGATVTHTESHVRDLE